MIRFLLYYYWRFYRVLNKESTYLPTYLSPDYLAKDIPLNYPGKFALTDSWAKERKMGGKKLRKSLAQDLPGTSVGSRAPQPKFHMISTWMFTNTTSKSNRWLISDKAGKRIGKSHSQLATPKEDSLTLILLATQAIIIENQSCLFRSILRCHGILILVYLTGKKNRLST